MEKEREVRCFIDDEEVDCKELQEEPLPEEDYYESYNTGRGSDA